MEATVSYQIREDDPTINNNNKDNLSITNILSNIPSINPIIILLSISIFIYSLCLMYGLYSFL